MNNRTFIDQMAVSLNMDADILQQQVSDFINVMLAQIKEGPVLSVKGFGVFEAKQKAERKIYNPTTKSFRVAPAKSTIAFKMGATLKEKLNS